MRKYEIHLPLHYNDGEPIEQEKIRSAQDELVSVFGSCAVPNQKTWKYDGVSYVEIMKVEIVTANDKVPRKSLRDFKTRLKESFRQLDVLITTQRIQPT
ncbi:MAG TPA: hypothetical protein DC054_25770 [Blastocatellia bacterium]|nr:hypothetical protein [Blastocatellia bacterium]